MTGNAAIDPSAVRRWWADQGADRVDVQAGWDAESPEQLDRLLRMESPDDIVDAFVNDRLPASSLTYGISLFVVGA